METPTRKVTRTSVDPVKGNELRTRRTQLKRTLFTMAIDAGVTPTTVANWETGKTPPSLKAVPKIAKGYRWSIEKATEVVVAMNRNVLASA